MVKYEDNVCDFTGILKLRCGHCKTARKGDTVEPVEVEPVALAEALEPLETIDDCPAVGHVETVEDEPSAEAEAPKPRKRKTT
jgi:hypothetical protein